MSEIRDLRSPGSGDRERWWAEFEDADQRSVALCQASVGRRTGQERCRRQPPVICDSGARKLADA